MSRWCVSLSSRASSAMLLLPLLPSYPGGLSYWDLFQIPEEVTDYYLQRVGFECEDVRL